MSSMNNDNSVCWVELICIDNQKKVQLLLCQCYQMGDKSREQLQCSSWNAIWNWRDVIGMRYIHKSHLQMLDHIYRRCTEHDLDWYISIEWDVQSYCSMRTTMPYHHAYPHQNNPSPMNSQWNHQIFFHCLPWQWSMWHPCCHNIGGNWKMINHHLKHEIDACAVCIPLLPSIGPNGPCNHRYWPQLNYFVSKMQSPAVFILEHIVGRAFESLCLVVLRTSKSKHGDNRESNSGPKRESYLNVEKIPTHFRRKFSDALIRFTVFQLFLSLLWIKNASTCWRTLIWTTRWKYRAS